MFLSFQSLMVLYALVALAAIFRRLPKQPTPDHAVFVYSQLVSARSYLRWSVGVLIVVSFVAADMPVRFHPVPCHLRLCAL